MGRRYIFKRICTIILIGCFTLLDMQDTTIYARSEARVKTVNLKVGQGYQIILGKKARIVKCKSEIIKVSKAGKVKALKSGKCTIRIKNGKKTKKIKFIVKNKTDAGNEKHKTGRTWIMDVGYIVDKIEQQNDEMSLVYFVADADEPNGRNLMSDTPEIKYIIMDVQNKKLVEGWISEVDKVCFVYNGANVDKKIDGDKCYLDNSTSNYSIAKR